MLNYQVIVYKLSRFLGVIGATLLALQRLGNFGTCLGGALLALLPLTAVGTVLVRK